MNLKREIVSCVLAGCLLNGCVSAPKPDLCSIDFDADTQRPYVSCTASDPNKEDYEQGIIESLGFICVPPEDFADIKAYIKYLLEELR